MKVHLDNPMGSRGLENEIIKCLLYYTFNAIRFTPSDMHGLEKNATYPSFFIWTIENFMGSKLI